MRFSYSSDKKKKESSKLSNKRQSLSGGLSTTPVVVKKQKLESGSTASSPKKSMTPAGPSSAKKQQSVTPMDKKDIKLESPKKKAPLSTVKSETKIDSEGFTVPAPVLVPLHPRVQAKMDLLAQEAKKGRFFDDYFILFHK